MAHVVIVALQHLHFIADAHDMHVGKERGVVLALLPIRVRVRVRVKGRVKGQG